VPPSAPVRKHRAGALISRFLAAALLCVPWHGTIAPTVFAQTRAATTFSQIQTVLKPGDRVTVTDARRQTVRGRVEALTASSLRIAIDGQRREFEPADTLRIERRRPDPLLNGALIGAAAGAALFLKYYSANALCHGNCQFTSGALALVGIGAGAGAGIDAWLVGHDTVFQQAPAMSRPRGSAPLSQAALGIAFRAAW
jgi:hypothetical protein